jgi:phosphatidate phosphatase APP1
LHPDKVRAIFIRRVQGVNEAKEKDLNSDKRFEKAFKGIPKNAWRVFNDPAELNEAVNALTST